MNGAIPAGDPDEDRGEIPQDHCLRARPDLVARGIPHGRTIGFALAFAISLPVLVVYAILIKEFSTLPIIDDYLAIIDFRFRRRIYRLFLRSYCTQLPLRAVSTS